MTIHRHYDLDQAEAAIRRMFADAPLDAISDDPATAEAYKRAAGVEVAMTRWFLNELNNGTPAELTVSALLVIFTNLIMNRMRSLDVEGGSMIGEFMPDLVMSVMAADAYRRENGRSAHSAKLDPVPSGRA